MYGSSMAMDPTAWSLCSIRLTVVSLFRRQQLLVAAVQSFPSNSAPVIFRQ
jgi:hypothetical protein